MKHGFVKSSPHFFRRIGLSAALLLALLVLGPLLMPAPLQPPADPGLTPNPAKSAWFLLWIQESVSWSRLAIYPIMLLAALFAALPWLPGNRPHRARWFPAEQPLVNLATVALFILLALLTIVACFFRGENWRLLW